MYESKTRRPLARPVFVRRLVLHTLIALGLIAFSIAVGMAGYHSFEHLPWLDAFLNASMLLGGMGPVGPVSSTGGKIFAGVFALYAGLVFLAVTALVLAPVLHYVLHRFHWDMSHPD